MASALSLAAVSEERDAGAPVERILAAARAVLAIVSLLATYVDPTEPRRFTPLAYTLLVGYSTYSIAVLLMMWKRPAAGLKIGTRLQIVDVVMAAALTLISEGPSSPFFPLFVYVVLCAAYRQGLGATIRIASWIVVLLIAEVALVRWLLPPLEEPLEMNRIIIRCAYLLLLAALVGYLADREKALRAEALLVTRLSEIVTVERGLSASLGAICEQLLRLTGMSETRFFFRDGATGRAYLWTATAGHAIQTTPFHWREPAPAEADGYSFPLPATIGAIQIVRRGPGRVAVLALNEESRRMPVGEDLVSGMLAGECGTIACVPLSVADRSGARLFLIHSSPRPMPAWRLGLVQRVARGVMPSLYNVYLLRRLRARAGELERARVARELHDGVIQSLMGLEMQLEVLRRDTAAAAPAAAERLGEVQSILHGEVLNVRDLMHQMRPVDADSRNLLQIISGIVERFRRETGMHTQFVSTREEVALPPRTCRELARIVQEALVNIRRHSGASNVVVRLEPRDNTWLLAIDDDGRGFDFAGRMPHDALESARKGPIVIRERVRAIGATLAIESTPGSGSRLEIAIPERAHG